MPWLPMEPTSSDEKGAYQTCMPEELHDFLMTSRVYSSTEDDLYISVFKRRMELIFIECYIGLSREYADAVARVELEPLLKDESGTPNSTQLEERSLWLCSVVNDCSRVLANFLSSMVNSDLKCPEIASKSCVFIGDRVHQASSTFESVIRTTLDTISCVIFAPCVYLLKDFENDWRKAAVTIDASGPIAEVMHIIRDSLHFYRYIIINSVYYIRLVEICADKIVILCLTLLKECSPTFTPAEIEKIGSDISIIKKGFLMCVKGPESEKHFAIIEIRLKRLQDIYYLITEDLSSASFINTTRRLIGESECDPQCDSIALSMLVNHCFQLRGWAENEMHREPLDELVSILRDHATEKPMPLSPLLGCIPPETRSFRMGSVGIDFLLTTAIDRNSVRPLQQFSKSSFWFLSTTQEFRSQHTGPKIKNLTVLQIMITDIFGLDTMIACAPSVYVVLTTNLGDKVITSCRTSYNPVWDEPVHLQFHSDFRLIDSAKLSCQVFFPIRFFGSSDVLYGSLDFPLNISDPITHSTESISSFLNINGDSKALQIALGKSIKRKAPMPKVSVHFRIDDNQILF